MPRGHWRVPKTTTPQNNDNFYLKNTVRKIQCNSVSLQESWFKKQTSHTIELDITAVV